MASSSMKAGWSEGWTDGWGEGWIDLGPINFG